MTVQSMNQHVFTPGARTAVVRKLRAPKQPTSVLVPLLVMAMFFAFCQVGCQSSLPGDRNGGQIDLVQSGYVPAGAVRAPLQYFR